VTEASSGPTPSDSAPPSGQPRLATLGILAVYACLLIALVQLLVFHLDEQSPIRQAGSAAWPQAKAERWLAAMDQTFEGAADTGGTHGNLALHFVGFDANDARQGPLACQYYFRAVYALYPRRVFVGQGDRVINFPNELLAADEVPDDRWLRSHGVTAVMTLHRTGDGASSKIRIVR
jgi:hypothetical protein